MSAPNSFVATSSLAGLVPVRVGGRPLIQDAPRVLALLRDRAPGLHGLFATPLLAKAAPGETPASASWYGIHDHAARLLREAPTGQREVVTAALRERLGEALGLLADPDLGPALRGLLTIPSADSVMVAGGHPVLINWGHGPDGLDPSPEGLRAHFDALFGPLCGVTWPAGAPEEGAEEGAPVASPTLATPAPAEPAPADPDPAARDELPAVGGDPQPAAEPPPPPPPAPPPAAVPPAPWYASRPVIVAAAILLGLLILGLLWWLLWAPGGLLNRSAPTASDLHGPVLEGLRQERDRLRALEGLACGPELDGALREGFTRPLTPHGPLLTPPAGGEAAPFLSPPSQTPPSQTPPSQTPPSQTPPAAGEAAPPLAPPPDLNALPATPASRMTALARVLEYAAALVVTDAPDGIGMGTAFFISKDTLVTNRHVVEDMGRDGRILITSQAMAGARPARLVASTPSSDIGGPDFAVLRLDAPVETAVPLTVATRVDKLSRVVTAGYPGYITESDAAYAELEAGSVGAAPSMVFTSGEVSVVQRQPSGATIVIHTADMSQGNSGGPLVDLCGRVVGVNTFIGMDEESGRRGLYALSGADLLAFLGAGGVAASQSAEACAEDGGPPPPADAGAGAATPADAGAGAGTPGTAGAGAGAGS
ncbi:trypsin-like peptidase domain-containing protein [Novispirillum sp. DQ9]|uniref:trypsin-like peptidase domain-containing protein n=1 Tax=Novispirillum sp. DQ9 TaxID=3398612 RepID=UPI003C7E27F2